MNDREMRFRCMELAVGMHAHDPSLDVIETADKLFCYASQGGVADHDQAHSDKDVLQSYRDRKPQPETA